ncbi:MAG TPA: hypothetical protein VFU22_22925 [Roseiflexaceae bacterium]|nr:hypothetical protein [Roseiflexaceae bacterium]
MASEQRTYHSYLLRLWHAGNGDTPEWRIVLEDVRTRERQSFVSVDQLATFLHAQIRDHVAGSATSAGSQLADDQSS